MTLAPLLALAYLAPPACPPGAICFSGSVEAGREFRKALDPQLDFVLQPGWRIAVEPKRPEGDCREFASVVNSPYRGRNALTLDGSYGVAQADEVKWSPRDFRFVLNCADYRTESARLDIVLWPYTFTPRQVEEALAGLGSSPLGTGRFWITGSTIKAGSIERLSFRVEIRLPRR